jgi:hypothetical protein
MFKKALLFGAIGATLIALPTLIAHYTIPFSVESYATREVIGYGAILLSMTMVFLSIRSRRRQLGGAISFGKAFGAGVLTAFCLAVVVGIYVVATFHLMYGPEEIKVFADHYREELTAAGKTPQEIETEIEGMKALFNSAGLQGALFGTTVFLIGAGCSAIFALILKRKPQRAS